MQLPVSVSLLDYRPVNVCVLAAIARVSTSKKSFKEAVKMSEEECKKWILEVICRGHTSVLEHAVYTFEAVCSRVCSHQLVRHRIASYTQQSMRYTEGFMREAILALAKIVGINVPFKPRKKDDYLAYAKVIERALDMLALVETSKDQSTTINNNTSDGQLMAKIIDALSRAFTYNPLWTLEHMLKATHTYLQALYEYYTLLASGASLEDARYVLPGSVKTRIIFTMNARELLEVFLPLRMCSRAQWEIRQLAWRVWELLNKVHPEIFAYAGPRCILLDLRARKKPCTLQDYLKGNCKPVIEQCPEKTPQQAILSCVKTAYNNSIDIVSCNICPENFKVEKHVSHQFPSPNLLANPTSNKL